MSLRSNSRALAFAAVALLLGSAGSAFAQPLNGNWTYQGRLTDAGVPANGSYDIQIAVYSTAIGGGAISVSFHNNVNVTNGLFTLPDVSTGFLGTFQGDRRWAEVQVRPGPSGGAFTVLSPRQELTATPYAMWANRAAVAGTVNNHTLDAAYDSGGAGNGRNILADAGAVTINGAGGLTVETTSRVGDGDTDGVFQLFTSTGAPTLELRDHADDGGAVEGYDELGNRTYFIEPDANGEGGFLHVYRNAAGSTAFSVDGNAVGGDPTVTINGSSRSMTFSPGAGADNNSVVLPVNSIASAEILDEPGVAAENNVGPSFPTQGAFVTMSSQSITVPAGGYVLALGTSEIVFSHANGTTTQFTFGLSDSSASLSGNQDFETTLSSALPTGSYDFTSSAHCLFTVPSAGTYTFYWLGREDSGNVSFANDTWMTLVYIPTAYGAVDPRGSGGGDDHRGDERMMQRPVFDDSTVMAQRDEAEQLNAERLDREVADLRAELAELRKLIANPDNKVPGVSKR